MTINRLVLMDRTELSRFVGGGLAEGIPTISDIVQNGGGGGLDAAGELRFHMYKGNNFYEDIRKILNYEYQYRTPPLIV